MTFKSCQFLLHTLNSLSQGRSKWVNRVDNVQGPRRRKEGNVLFNDALNTLYLRLYGVGHMVKDHMGYSFRLTAMVFYMHHPTDRIAQTTAFVTPVMEHWLEREIDPTTHRTMSTISEGPGTPTKVIPLVGRGGGGALTVPCPWTPEGLLLRQCSFPAILSEMEVGNDVCALRFYYSLKLFKL